MKAMPGELKQVISILETRYPQKGRDAAQRLREWLSGQIPFSHPEVIEQLLFEERADLLFDSFWQVLPFGTGGRRGPVGYGANRINTATVAMTVQGHCQYLRGAFPSLDNLTVVVANDVRVFNDVVGVYDFLGDHPLLGASSRSLAMLACEIYAGNGITVYLSSPGDDDAVLTTPELSFLIWKLSAQGGINLSASHNPPDDNGIKVYDQFGSQPIAPEDQQLADAMTEAKTIEILPFEEALRKGLVRGIPEEAHKEYVQTYVALYGDAYAPDSGSPIVYTPLCGCGKSTVGKVLERLGYEVLVRADQEADGSFSAIPLRAPNPEVLQATEPARDFADEHSSAIVLSSDPDADRVGLEVRLGDGSWYHFDGNQIATILCYYLMLDPQGPQRKGLVIETLVTTKTLRAIAERAGDSWVVDDLLVGFKYIADVLKGLAEKKGRRRPEITCSPEALVIAAEESHGIMMVPTIRDKDATPACMFLAALYQRLLKEGRNLFDYYVSILDIVGGFDCVNRSIMLRGADGMLKKDRIMQSLRDAPPKEIGGSPIRDTVDYWDVETHGPFLSETDRMSRNVIQVSAEELIVTIRPSGTEPKLKFYCQLLPRAGDSARGIGLAQSARKKASTAAQRIYNQLLERVDLSLGEAGLLLPDIIDLDRKREFESKSVDRIRDALVNGGYKTLDEFLDRLQDEVGELIPGTDALPAIRASLRHLVDRWSDELSSVVYLRELRHWLA